LLWPTPHGVGHSRVRGPCHVFSLNQMVMSRLGHMA